MMLTTEQLDALKRGEPVYIVPDEIGLEVVIIRGDVYDGLAGLFDDWDPHVMRQGMSKLMEEHWSDPEMTVYDGERGKQRT